MIKMVKLREEHLEMVLGWRTKDYISKSMLTSIDNSIENQRKWFNSVRNSDQYKYWVINYKKVPIGLIYLSDIDRENLKCSGGYYIGEENFKSLGAVILPYLYNYIFKTMGFRKVFGSVMSDNKTILKIHEMHGYRTVGVYEKHIKKGNNFIDVILVELMADVWLSKRKFMNYDSEWEE